MLTMTLDEELREPAAGPLSLHLDVQAEATVVRLAGDLDLSGAHLLGEALIDAQALGLPVVVDCSALAFIDSSGIAELVAARNRTGQLTLAGLPPVVLGTLQIAAVTDLFDLLPAPPR